MSFSQLPAVKKDTENGAPGNFFGPSYFVTALVIEKKLLKFEAEGREFAKSLISLEQFIQTVKGQNNFW